MLKAALNTLTRIHSRPAILKRLGTVDIASPIRITPSNYFRFLRGPEYTTIAGKEFIIPVDSILGQYGQRLVFSGVPTSGSFKIQFGASVSDFISYNATSSAIQTTLRLMTGLDNVLVTGDFTAGFLITFSGFQSQPAVGVITSSTLDRTGTFSNTYASWPDEIQKGDRIIETGKTYSIDEIMEMPDLGGKTMAFRVRVD